MASQSSPLPSSRPGRDNLGSLDSIDNLDSLSISSSTSSSSSSASSSSSSSALSTHARTVRAISLVAAITSALCAGSITVFSLYGHIFQERLRYSQFQINGLAIAGALALYLPVSVLGYVCDRSGTRLLSGLAAVAFATGYGLAAWVYRRLDAEYSSRGSRPPRPASAIEKWSYPLMVAAFVCIGVGTSAMYLSAVATCAKNFAKGRHRGLALAAPIAAFGLSGMWISQVGSRLLCERLADGRRGDVDVGAFFTFLAVMLFVVGVVGMFALRVVGERELIEEAAEELERSGLLDGRGRVGYGSIEDRLASLSEDGEDQSDSINCQKRSVLNAETKQFLMDPTMWFLALSFLLITGPGEAFINNLGTIIGTLNPPPDGTLSPDVPAAPRTTAATHVSIVGVASTIARLATGTLTDVLAPRPETRHLQYPGPYSRSSSPSPSRFRFSMSRISFLVLFALVLSLGLVVLASGAAQGHADRFWIVSGLVGAGYGAVFSLTPIVIAVIWGVENFATNWGVVAMAPAVGSTVWGLAYSAVYQREAANQAGGGGDGFCYGSRCYSSTAWTMAATVWVAAGILLWAWRGSSGWKQRGIVV